MIETIGGGVLGTLLGGLFRMAPEILKWLDRKDERKHELAMFDRQVDLEKTRGDIKLQEIGAQRDAAIDTGVIGAFQAAMEQQTEMVKAAGGWAATISALVRPLLTFWIWGLYSLAFLTLLYITWEGTKDPAKVAQLVLTADFMTILAGITNFWFLDRVLKRRGLS
jgi:hypothetical protein